MTTNGKLNPKEVRDDKYEEKAQLKAIEEKIYQTMYLQIFIKDLTFKGKSHLFSHRPQSSSSGLKNCIIHMNIVV